MRSAVTVSVFNWIITVSVFAIRHARSARLSFTIVD